MDYGLQKGIIKVDRELNKLDKFVLRFIRILKKHVDYVIVSGYVSILLGRARATEDIDIFIDDISFEAFSKLYKELNEERFWCLNAENAKEVFAYLEDGLAVRFAEKDTIVPNFEIKSPKNSIDKETLKDLIVIVLPDGELNISSIERQIAFKRYCLGTNKDIEDALHLEELFKDKLDYNKINKIKGILKRR